MPLFTNGAAFSVSGLRAILLHLFSHPMLQLLSIDSFLFAVLIGGAFLAGFVDSIVGGGGLIQVPILFSALPNEVPARLFGTNKIASIFGTTNAAWRFARRITIPWRTVIPATIAAFIFSYLGAMSVAWLPIKLVRPMILILLVFAAIYAFMRKDFGHAHAPRLQGSSELLGALAIGASVGFYDGFFGPGAGSFLIFLFVRFFGFDFLHASASSKIVNAVTNLGSLIFFIPNGLFLPLAAVLMALANVGGSVVGTRLALRHGSAFVRKIFLCVVSVLIVKVAWYTVKQFIDTTI